MLQTINPAKTAQIMSRYRPIAPKPAGSTETDPNSDPMPDNIKKSPYLRNVWAHLQARPTRTRKRGRSAAFAPPSLKRTRTCLQGLISPQNLAMHGFIHHTSNGVFVPIQCGVGLDAAVSTLSESVSITPFDLNTTAEVSVSVSDPIQELDFMPQLKEPVKATVISPRAIRPVGSKIIVENAIEVSVSDLVVPVIKTTSEVEKEVEDEELPALVSDSSNIVRHTNSAYREMVGQPECCWLVAACGGACRRIGGEVVLQLGESEVTAMQGFEGRVKIEWESNNKKKKKKSVVVAECRGEKLLCEKKDYQFLWRFNVISEE